MAAIIDNQRKLIIQHGFLEDLQQRTEKFSRLAAIMPELDWQLVEQVFLPKFQQVDLLVPLSSRHLPDLTLAQNLARDLAALDESHEASRKRLLDGSLTVRWIPAADFSLLMLSNEDHGQWRLYSGSRDLMLVSYGEKEESDEDWAVFQQVWLTQQKAAKPYLTRDLLQEYAKADDADRAKVLLKASGLAELILKEPVSSFKEAARQAQLRHGAENRRFRSAVKLLKIKEAIDPKQLESAEQLLADEELGTKLAKLAIKGDVLDGEAISLPDEPAHYPKPMYLQDQATGTIIEKPDVDSYQKTPVVVPKPSRQDVSAIFDIVRFYRDRKQDNESQAAFSFLMYVLESGSIWKIRQAIDQRNGIVEDVPIVVGLIGQGETGKSTLLKIASNLTIGNTKSIVQASSEDKLFGMTAAVRKKLLAGKSLTKQDRASAYSSNSKVINKNIWSFTDRYMDVDSSITPICIDDPEVSLFSSAAAQTFLKKRSNRHGDKLGVEPVAIFSMNSKGKDIELLAEVGRRGYVISQGNQFRKKTDADIHFFEYLDGNTDNHGHWLNNALFLYLTRQIDRWVENMTDSDYLKLKRDFLYPVKHAFWQLVKEYDLVNTETKYYFNMKNYNLADDLGRRNWSILLHDEATLREITFARDAADCTVPARVFPNKNDIQRYFGYLPSAAEICKTFDSQGLTINFANMDMWQGNHLLTERYEKATGIAAERFEMEKAKAAAEVQGQTMGANIAPYLKKNAEMMDKMMQVTQENAQLVAEKQKRQEEQEREADEKRKQAEQIQQLQDQLAEAKAAQAAKEKEDQEKNKEKRGFFHFFK